MEGCPVAGGGAQRAAETKAPPARFDYLRLFSSAVSVVAVFYVLFVYFQTTESDEHQVIHGMHYIYPNGSLLFSSPDLQFSDKNFFLSIYIKVMAEKRDDEPMFYADATMTCQSKSDTQVLFQNITALPAGEAELYTSWYPIYHSMMIELLIAGSVTNSTQVSLLVVRMSKKFADVSIKLNAVMKYSSLIVCALYALFTIFVSRSRCGFLQIYSVIALAVAVAVNFPFNHGFSVLSKGKHCAYLLLRGTQTAVNIVALFGASMFFYSSENIGTAMLIAILFIFAEAMCTLTTDSFILSDVFDNNGIIWVFFFSSSIISKVSLAVLTGHHIVMSAVNASNKRRKLYFVYHFLALLLLVFPAIIRAFIIVVQGYQNSSINFFCDYINQFIFTLLFAQLCWPSTTKYFDPSHIQEVMNMETHDFAMERDMSVQFERPEE